LVTVDNRVGVLVATNSVGLPVPVGSLDAVVVPVGVAEAAVVDGVGVVVRAWVAVVVGVALVVAVGVAVGVFVAVADGV
jgi:hypothetical protein